MIEIDKLFNINNFRCVVLQINNYCNLNCEHCCYLSNTPISPKSENLWRRKPWTITVEEATLYCERFKDIDIPETQWVGGEPTMIPLKRFNKLVNVFDYYKKGINLLTNGYNIFNINKDILNKIKTITLDNHSINSSHLDKCTDYLKTFYKGEIKRWTVTEHIDLRASMKHQVNKGKSCPRWMTEIKINDYVVFPCCTMPAMMVLDNNPKFREELIKAGWTLKNEDLIEVMKNHKTSVPDYVRDQCLNNCFMPNINAGGNILPITLKDNDVIAAPKR